jgi:hypothetical protein
MANHYTEFSEAIEDITEEELAWLNGIPDRGDFEDITLWDEDDWQEAYAKVLLEHGIDTSEFVEGDLDLFPHFSWEAEKGGNWWISTHGDEWGNVAHVACVVHAFIKKFRPDFVFTLTWCSYCSKPRIGEFGGGWVVVSKDKMEFGDAWSAADKTAAGMKK